MPTDHGDNDARRRCGTSSSRHGSMPALKTPDLCESRQRSRRLVHLCSYGGCRGDFFRPRRVRAALLLVLVSHYARQQWLLAGRTNKAEMGSDDAVGSKKIARESIRGTYGTRKDGFPSLMSPSGIRQREHQAIDVVRHEPQRPKVVKILYVGEFGLGHRLSKMSAAYHLAHMIIRNRQQRQGTATPSSRSVDLDVGLDELELESSWGTCTFENGTKLDVLSSLFGPEPLLSPPPSVARSSSASAHTSPSRPVVGGRSDPSDSSSSQATILIRNDVKGYYAGQMYKNARLPLTPDLVEAWDYKMRTTDLQLFRLLFHRFRHVDVATAYQRERNWDDHFVVGIHFRLGNGEQDHFVASKRSVADARRLVHQTVRLVLRYRESAVRRDSPLETSHDKPWAIFVASDTPSVMSMVQDALDRFQQRLTGDLPSSISLWASPSMSHLPDHGVSYTITQSHECLNGWKFAVLDQYLLSHVQVLVAPTRSTFTQIVPRAMVLSKPPHPLPPPIIGGLDENRASDPDGPNTGSMGGGTFCEIAVDASGPSCPPRMSCYDDSLEWLLRRNASRIVRVSSGNDDTESSGVEGACQSASDESHNSYVPHKVLVHLPETVHEWKLARDEWRATIRKGLPSSRGAPRVARYGERIAQKYRSYAFHPDWSFA